MSTAQFRRIANRVFGTGPWRIVPFAEIVAHRNNACRFDMHRAASLAGVVCHEEDVGFEDRAGRAILDQPDPGEFLP
jgi:hypothetical protein